MNVRIGLARSDYNCLLDKVPDDSPLCRVFEPKKADDGVGRVEFEDSGALPMGDDVIIYCSTEDAEQLLELAVPSCPYAVNAIRQALRGHP